MNQQGNPDGIETESRASTKTNKKKRSSASSKNTSKFNSEPIHTAYTESKKMKKDILSMQNMKNVPEEFQARLQDLITKSDLITCLLDECMEEKCASSTVQKQSEDNDSD